MKMYVGNLAFSATDHGLGQLFEPYGAVDMINIITTVIPVNPVSSVSSTYPTALQPMPPFRGSRARRLESVRYTSAKQSHVNRDVSPVGPAGKHLVAMRLLR